MSTRNYTSLGIMTGTSLDAVDLSLIKSDGDNNISFLGGQTYDFTYELRNNLRSILGSTKRNSATDLIEENYTLFVISKIKSFLKNRKEKIDLIGFHGQTITHNPKKGFTWQIGDAKKIYDHFKINTIYDFRSKDIKNGGNGAPLTPIFHKLLMNKFNLNNVAFINLGGIANITYISKNEFKAFDCGPCCCISNQFTKDNINKEFDKDGLFASRGKVDFNIIKKLLKNNFFKIQTPKSLDTLDINIKEVYKLNLYDGLATINEFIAKTICLSLRRFSKDIQQLVFLGGGKNNIDLTSRIMNNIDFHVRIIDDLEIENDLVESYAFAYLAIRSFNKKFISFPLTTGVKKPMTGGKILKDL